MTWKWEGFRKVKEKWKTSHDMYMTGVEQAIDA